MKLVTCHYQVSDVIKKWYEDRAKEEASKTGACVSTSDIIRRALGEWRNTRIVK